MFPKSEKIPITAYNRCDKKILVFNAAWIGVLIIDIHVCIGVTR